MLHFYFQLMLHVTLCRTTTGATRTIEIVPRLTVGSQNFGSSGIRQVFQETHIVTHVLGHFSGKQVAFQLQNLEYRGSPNSDGTVPINSLPVNHICSIDIKSPGSAGNVPVSLLPDRDRDLIVASVSMNE
jgi:hypothetical protein